MAPKSQSVSNWRHFTILSFFPPHLRDTAVLPFKDNLAAMVDSLPRQTRVDVSFIAAAALAVGPFSVVIHHC